MDELIVHIKALLNRKPAVAEPDTEQYTIGHYYFDYSRQKLLMNGQE